MVEDTNGLSTLLTSTPPCTQSLQFLLLYTALSPLSTVLQCVKVYSKFWRKSTPTLLSLPKASDEVGDSAELYVFKWTTLLIPPSTLLIINLVGVVAGISNTINSGFRSSGSFSLDDFGSLA